MRFLANENIPGALVRALRGAGNDVIWIAGVGGTRRAYSAYFDKDFGELAKASGLPPACGVILLRVPMPRADEVGQRLTSLIMARHDWAGHFSVIEPGRVRMRSLRK